jgi:hypothetical protein
MSAGIRLHTDPATYAGWLRMMPAPALPAELSERSVVEPGLTAGRSKVPLPPLVAAALALHACAELAVIVQLWAPAGGSFGCIGIAGELGASVRRAGDQVEIGLFRMSALVDEVVRLIPDQPPVSADCWADEAAENVGVQVAVFPADAVEPGWRRTLIGAGQRWCRSPGPGRSGGGPGGFGAPDPEADPRQEMVADLRFALVGWLAAEPVARGGKDG